MLKKLADRILRAPAAADGGTAVADPHDSDPSALSSWMTDLPQIETNSPLQPATPDAQPKKEPDGKSAEKSDGTGGAGLPGGAKPAEPADSKTANAADSKPVADDAAKPDAKPDAKPAGVEDKGKTEEKKEDKEPVEKWPRTSADWDKFKAARKEEREKLQGEVQAREERIKALETELGTVREASAKADEPTPEVKAQLEKLTKENEEYSRRLQVLDVTQHPKFQAYFDNKENAQKELAKRIVGEEKAKAFNEILSLADNEYRNQRIEEFMADLSPLSQSRIGGVLNNLEAIAQEKASEIAKAKDHKTTLTAQQVEKQKASIAARDRLVNATVGSLQSEKDGMALFQKKAGDDVWNRGVDERIARGKKLLTGEGVEQAEVVKAAFYASAFPGLLASYQQALKAHAAEMSKLEAQVKTLSAAQPGAGGTATSPAGGETGGAKTEVKIGQSPQEAAAAWTKGLWQDNG